MSPVYRFEQAGENGIPFPSLAAAVRCMPSHGEARVATSVDGVVLAEARHVAGAGTMLQWVLTNAGRDVQDFTGWTAEAPTLTQAEYDTVLELALGDTDLKAAS